MARMNLTTESRKRLGAYLRQLREARSLSLRSVSEHSRRRAKDSAGRISHGYLNQLEHGLPVALALPKLLSLAAVYNVSAEIIIAQLPEPLLSQRLADLESWRTEKRPFPRPLLRVPGRHERTDPELDALFAKRARGFVVDWEWKTYAESEARSFLPYAILPPFLESSLSLVSDFWALHPSEKIGQPWTRGTAGPLALRAGSPWETVTVAFTEWAIRATDAIVAAVRLVSWWNLDFTTSGASCHFSAPDIEARYGFDAVPPRVVAAVRGCQLAQFLSRHGTPRGWPPPPDPIDGARQFVEYLLRPQPFDPEHAPDEPPAAPVIWGSLSALARLVPTLRPDNCQVNAAILNGVAALLNRAAVQSTPSPPGRKQRAKPPKR